MKQDGRQLVSFVRPSMFQKKNVMKHLTTYTTTTAKVIIELLLGS